MENQMIVRIKKYLDKQQQKPLGMIFNKSIFYGKNDV